MAKVTFKKDVNKQNVELRQRLEKFKNDMEKHEKDMGKIKFKGNFSALTVYRMMCAFLGLDPDKEVQKVQGWVNHNQCDICLKQFPTALGFHRHYIQCLASEK